jgi:serine/threonine-protein kinase RsbW
MQQLPEPEIRPNNLHLVLVADPASVRDGLRRMLTLPPLAGLAPDRRGTAELVLAEVLNNVAEHAYADRSGTVEVTLSSGTCGVSCTIVDHGVAMPGDALPAGRLPVGTDIALQDLPEGGFGWHLIRTLTLDLAYARIGGRNQLSFTLPRDG